MAEAAAEAGAREREKELVRHAGGFMDMDVGCGGAATVV